MLLRDADVEEAVGKAGLEGQQAGGTGHGCGQRHNAWVLFGGGQERAGERIGVGGGALGRRDDRGLGCGAGRGDAAAVRGGGAAHTPAGRVAHRVVEGDGTGRLHVVEALDVVLFGGGVPAPLLGQDVDDDRAVPLGRMGEGLLHVLDVVAVDRTGVSHAECFEEGVRRHHVAQCTGDRMHAGIGQLAQRRELAQAQAQAFPRCGVGRIEPQCRQAL